MIDANTIPGGGGVVGMCVRAGCAMIDANTIPCGNGTISITSVRAENT